MEEIESSQPEENQTENPYKALKFLDDYGCKVEEKEDMMTNRQKRQIINVRPSEDEGEDEDGNCKTCSVPTYLDTEYTFLQVFMSLEETERFLIGHNFTGLVKSCTFSAKNPLKPNFVLFIVISIYY